MICVATIPHPALQTIIDDVCGQTSTSKIIYEVYGYNISPSILPIGKTVIFQVKSSIFFYNNNM